MLTRDDVVDLKSQLVKLVGHAAVFTDTASSFPDVIAQLPFHDGLDVVGGCFQGTPSLRLEERQQMADSFVTVDFCLLFLG